MSKLRQLQDEGRLTESPMARDARQQKSRLRMDSSVAAPTPGERTFDKPKVPDTDAEVMVAVDRFFELAKREGVVMPVSKWTVQTAFIDRVEVSKLRFMVNPYTGKSMWPDVLVTLVDVYFDSEHKVGDTWSYKRFVADKVFNRLVEWLVFQIEKANNPDTRTVEDKRREREEYLASIRGQVTPKPPPAAEAKQPIKVRPLADIEDEEFEAAIAKRVAAWNRKQKARRTRERNKAKQARRGAEDL